jgi:outer membrane protein assembly factor BamB
VELKAISGSLVRTIKAKADELKFPRAIVVNLGHVWVQDGDNTLTELNASSGKLVRVISTKLEPNGFNSSDGLALSGSHISILNIYSGQKGSVTELNANNGNFERVIK